MKRGGSENGHDVGPLKFTQLLRIIDMIPDVLLTYY